MQRSRRSVVVLICTAVSLIPAACGLPEASTLEPIPDDQIPAELRTATTTTTSTTTTTTTPPEPPPTTSPPTTDPANGPVPVDVYYGLPGTEEQMFLYRAALDPPGSREAVVDLLTMPPVGAIDEGLRTAVRRDLIADWTIDRGTAEVELNAQALDFMSESSKRRAVAQIVLTFTSYAPPGEGGIGQIQFVVDDEPYAVITSQGASGPGEGVAFEDFEQLIVNQPNDVSAGKRNDAVTATATIAPPTTAG